MGSLGAQANTVDNLVRHLEELSGTLSDTPISRLRLVDIDTIRRALIDAAQRISELERADK